MCGNIGMITAVNNKDTRDFMRMGLYVDALRGRHSTGLATVDAKGEILVIKKAMDANDFLTITSVDKQINDSTNKVFIGHNRHATRGAINNINAHPFQHGKITMAHNGSLSRTHTLPDHTKFDVDSENIAHSLDKIGTIETLKLLDGAFALVWYDSEEKRVKMARNSERPLSIATIKNKNTIIWASEFNMLQFIASRSGLEISDSWSLPENTIASFDPESNNIWECDIQEDVEYYKYEYTPPRFQHKTSTLSSINDSKEGREETKKKIKERDIINQKLFKDCGIKKGSEVDICLYNFTPYNLKYPSAGTWEGCTLDDPYVSVVVYGLKSDDYDVDIVYRGEAMCMQIVDSSRNINDKMNHRLIIDSKTIYDTEAEYAEGTIILANAPAKIEPRETKIIIPTQRKITLSEKKDAVKKLLNEVEDKVRKSNLENMEKEGGVKKKSILTISGEKEEYNGDGESEFGSANVDFLYLMGPRGLAIPYSEWMELTKHGCGVCVSDLKTEDAKHIAWWGDLSSPVCPTCSLESTSLKIENTNNLH